MTPTPDPTSLEHLFDIVVPPPVSWWPTGDPAGTSPAPLTPRFLR